MPIWTDRYLILLGTVGIALSVGIGYQYAIKRTYSVPAPRTCMPAHLLKDSLQDVQLPSVIPHFRIGAKRHLFFPVDLRRVDLLADMQSDTPLARPLLDKVLFVPKEFVHRRDA